MVRARSLMGLHPALDGLHIAPGNNRIDQMIAPTVLEIFFRKALAFPFGSQCSGVLSEIRTFRQLSPDSRYQ